MSSFIVQIEDNPLKSIQIETSIGNNPASIEVQTFDNNIIQIESGLTLTPPEVAEVLNARIVDFLEAGSGIYFNINNDSFTINSSTLPHLHSANDIVGLSSYVVNNAPVRNILASSGVFVENNSGIFSISLSTSGLQPSGNYSIVGHNHNISDINNLQITLDLKQPSGNYSLVGHNHVANDITNFESAVSGYAPVKSVAGKYGTVTLNKGDVGLSNVDNTSDLNKPISTSVQIALDTKQPSGNYSLIGHSHSSSDISNFNSSVSGLVNGIYAPLNNPSLIGVPTAPTASSGISNNQIANTQFVRTEISNLVNSAPSTLDTLNELAIALGNDPAFATTISNSLGQKANLSGASFTGSVTAPSGNFSVLQQNGVSVSISGHSHVTSNITDFNSSVSGLLPVKNVVGNGYIGVSSSSGNYTVFATGLQPSGNYANSIHSHAIGDVTGLQTALDSKALTSHIHDDRYYTENEIDNLLSLKQSSGNYSLVGHVHTSSDITNFSSSVSGLVSGIYAPLNSPSLTGIPTAPTASSGTSNNQIASTQFVRNELSNLVNSAPTALDTLNELAIALGNDANFSTTVTNSLAQKANISGTSFTGSVTAPSGNFTVLQQNGVTVSVNGHTHNVSSITDFNSSVSGLLPVTNITGGTNISVVPNGTNFTVSVSGQLGLTAEEVDDRVNSLLVSDTGIVLSYNDNANTLTISTSGLQPSGNYSLIGHSHVSSDITNFNASVSGLVSGIYAPLNSPALTGIPTVPTANSGTNNNQAASTAFVRTEISNLVSSAPSTLDTLNELATALGNDANFSTTVTNALAGKANLNGATFTGAISSPSGNFTQSLLVNGTAVSVSGHSHNVSNISDFNSGVLSAVYSGVIPLNSGLFVKTRTGGTLQSTTLSSNDITDFNSSVSGILPVKNIVAGSGISINNNSGIYTINSTATGSSSTSVIEYNNVSNFPSSGVGSIIYISTDTGRIYRWASSVYQELGPVSYAPIGSDSRWDLFLPPAPTGLVVTPGNTQIVSSWNAPTVSNQTPITDYTIQYSTNSGLTWTTFIRSASTSTTVSITGLTNGQAYVLRVAAVNGIGTGAYSTVSRAVAPFNPPSITGLQLWLDSSDASTLFDATTGGSLVAADGSVARWQDKSGNARHATQSSSNSRPLRKTAIQGGKDVLRFDGSNDFVTCSIGSIQNCTVFAVFANQNQSIDSEEIDNVFAFGPFPDPPDNKGFAVNSSNVFASNTQRQIFLESLATGSVTRRKNGNTSPVTLNLGEFCVLSAVASGVSNNFGSTFSVCRLWFQSIPTVFYGKNDICELIVYNSALSDANRSAVESYLISKWNIV
jgi:hypothetical protein